VRLGIPQRAGRAVIVEVPQPGQRTPLRVVVRAHDVATVAPAFVDEGVHPGVFGAVIFGSDQPRWHREAAGHGQRPQIVNDLCVAGGGDFAFIVIFFVIHPEHVHGEAVGVEELEVIGHQFGIGTR
jgi:hypothetical protein